MRGRSVSRPARRACAKEPHNNAQRVRVRTQLFAPAIPEARPASMRPRARGSEPCRAAPHRAGSCERCLQRIDRGLEVVLGRLRRGGHGRVGACVVCMRVWVCVRDHVCGLQLRCIHQNT